MRSLQPIFGRFGCGVANMVCKLFGSSCYLFANQFDGIPISMSTVLKSEVVFEECSLHPRCAIDEKHGVGAVVFLVAFLQDLFCHDDCSCRNRPYVQECVRFGSDSSVQPVSLIVELNHGFVTPNVIRALPIDWL
jgi:hypothetical protein